MMAPGHLLSGAVAGVLAAPFAPLPDHPAALPVFVGITTIGALVPDLDQPGSTLARTLPPITGAIAHMLALLSRVVHEATRGTADRDGGSGHRTLTHTLAFALVLGGVVLVSVPSWPWALCSGTAVVLGCLAHLAGDALTIHGVPVLWPISRHGQRWYCYGVPRPLRFRTGGKRGVGRRHSTVSSYGGAWTAIGEQVTTTVLLLVFLAGTAATILGHGSWLTLLA